MLTPLDAGSTQMCFTQLFVKRTFGPLRLLGATLMCIAQTIISYPLNLFYLASTLVCIAQIILISITLVAGYQLACDVVGMM